MNKIIKLLIPSVDISNKIYFNYKCANFFLKKKCKCISKCFSYKIYRKYHCCISNKSSICDGLYLPHPMGIVIGEGVYIGKNVTIYQNVTLGRKNKDIAEYPTIGDNVTIYCNSVIIGNVKIGNNAVIGCNSVVLRDVKDGEVVSGIVK